VKIHKTLSEIEYEIFVLEDGEAVRLNPKVLPLQDKLAEAKKGQITGEGASGHLQH
jgi:hypothetical protein